jgi:hypothetical protein
MLNLNYINPLRYLWFITGTFMVTLWGNKNSMTIREIRHDSFCKDYGLVTGVVKIELSAPLPIDWEVTHNIHCVRCGVSCQQKAFFAAEETDLWGSYGLTVYKKSELLSLLVNGSPAPSSSKFKRSSLEE